MFIKDSSGNKSLTVTMSIITFIVVMVKVLLGGTSFSFGGSTMSFEQIGADVIVSLLGPTLGAYSFRRYTDRRFDKSKDDDAGSKSSAGAE